MDGVDLLLEERLAGHDLIGLGIPVLGRPAFNNIRYPDVLPWNLETLLDDVGQELARAPDEGEALLVLFRPRRLAHEHEARGRVSLAEDDGLAPAGKLATLAVAQVLAHRSEIGAGIPRCGGGRGRQGRDG